MMMLAAIVCLVVVAIGYAEADLERQQLERAGNRRGALVAVAIIQLAGLR